MLQALLPLILPLAVRWAEEQEELILRNGSPLSPQGLIDAQEAGVVHAAKIRLLHLPRVPMPGHPLLLQAAQKLGLVMAETAGMTLRYGIFIREDCRDSRRLVAHECVHTAQYEQMGGIGPFLESYLRECLEKGYPGAPLEQAAIEGENRICSHDARRIDSGSGGP